MLQYRFFSNPFQKFQRTFQLFFASFGERCIDFDGFGGSEALWFRNRLQRYCFFEYVYNLTASAGQHRVMQKLQTRILVLGLLVSGAEAAWTDVRCWRSSVRYVSCCCQLKYVVKNMILKYVQSNENIMCINVSNFFPFQSSVE